MLYTIFLVGGAHPTKTSIPVQAEHKGTATPNVMLLENETPLAGTTINARQLHRTGTGTGTCVGTMASAVLFFSYVPNRLVWTWQMRLVDKG